MKHLITILSLFTLHSSLFAVFAAVPLRWTVETSRAVPATFEAYQGETLELEAALQSYGKPLEAPANYALYWQTNGMGSTWWEAPVSSAPSPTNVLRATWRPECDVGAKAYTCFIGAPGTIYHAAFQLRLRPSPGATPNELPLPQKTIDFATVEVLNPDAAPWASTNAVQAAQTAASNAQQTADEATRLVGALADDVTAAQTAATNAQQTASAAQTAATTAQQTADEATRSVGALADEKRDKTDLDYGGFWIAGDVVLRPNEDYEYQPCFESADGAKRLYWEDTWYYAYQVDPLRESYAYDSETGGDMVYDLRAAEFWVGPDGSRVRAVFAPKTRLATTNDVSSAVAQIGEVAARAVSQPEGSAEPDDYRVQIGHGATATGPAGADADSAGRNQSIAIGYNATATNWTSVAIGSGGWSELTNAQGVVTGRVTNAATADGREAVAIGYGAKAHGNMSTAVGKLARAHGDYSAAFGAQSVAGQHGVAIGFGADAATHGMQRAIAIGRYASASAENSVQLFTGTNDVANSIKIGNTFVWSGGHPANEDDPCFKTFTNSLFKTDPVRFNAAIGHGAAVVTTEGTTTNTSSVAIGRSARVEPAYGDAQASVAIGMQTRSANISAITIGHSSSNYGKRSVAIGRDVTISNDTDQANMDAIAIGYQAKVYRQQGIAIGKTAVVNGIGAVQIGTGENTAANTLKFRNTTVVGGDGKVPFASLAGAYPEASGNQLSALVTMLSGQVNGSNVVFAVTNYMSGAYVIDAAKLKMLELRDGQYREVYNSRDEILLHLGDFETNKLNATRAELRAEIAAVLAEMQHDAWGRRTSTGNPAPSNTIYTTEPSFVFGGGLEYERIAVGAGAVGILANKGAPSYTAGDSGTFLFKDATGENYFGYSMTQGYAIGVPTDGILVEGQRVTLTYNIVGSCPIVMWCPALFPGCAQDITGSGWHQLNDEDGNPIEGAPFECAVDMESTPEVATVYIDTGANPTGFFSAWTSVPGKSSFKTNMPVDLDAAHGGGVLSSDGITVIVPQPDGTWRPANEN